MVRILHLEDSAEDAELVQGILQSEGIPCEFHRATDREAFLASLEEGGFDLILSDYSLPGFDGVSALASAVEKCPDAPFIFVSGTIGEEHAIESLRKGATDYVLKQRLSRLAPAVRRALKEKEERKARAEAERKLHEVDAAFRQIVENLREVFYLASPGVKQVLYVNPAYPSVWGRSRDSLYENADSWMAAVHAEDHEKVIAAIHESRRSGRPFEGVYRIVRPDGVVRWVHDRSFPVEGQGGEIRGVAGFAEDITERRQADERLREQATLLDKASDAILASDVDRRIRFWNKGAEALYGWTLEEARGRNVVELLRTDAETAGAARAAVLECGEWSGELRKQRKDGTVVLVESRWTLVRDEGGRPLSILAIDTDLTEKKRLQAQMLRAQRMDSLGTLAGGIAHDLNNVLAPIVMATEILKRNLPDERSQRMVRAIELGSQRAADMVKQILTFARGAEGERTVLQPRQIVEDIGKIIQETFPKTIRIQVEVGGDLWRVSGDPTQLHQVLLNLCVNARDAMPRGGLLTLRAQNVALDEHYTKMNPGSRPGPYVVLDVTDTGSGIPAEMRERIFEPFFTTKEVGKGTGLGLSTSLSIVKSHGGFVSLYSEKGKGTAFRVHLPAAQGVAAGADAPAVSPLGQGELVLVVEDEAAIRELTKETLESHGYRVLTASDGAEGVTVFNREHGGIGLVLTDMSMPLMDGGAAILAVRAIEPRVKVVTMSGFGLTGDTSAGQEAVDATLLKPFTAHALLSTVRAVLDERKEGH